MASIVSDRQFERIPSNCAAPVFLLAVQLQHRLRREKVSLGILMEANRTQLKAALLRNDGHGAHTFLTGLTPFSGVNGLGGAGGHGTLWPGI